MMISGICTSLYVNSIMPTGKNNMEEHEIEKLLITQQQNEDINIIGGVSTGIGFLLILISFGLKPSQQKKK